MTSGGEEDDDISDWEDEEDCDVSSIGINHHHLTKDAWHIYSVQEVVGSSVIAFLQLR